MKARAIKILRLTGNNPTRRGHEHGESLRDWIRDLSLIRMERMRSVSSFKSENSVIELAQEHLPLLKKYDENLFLEFKAISEGSNISLERLIVLNNYTDMRDIARKEASHEGCSLIYSPKLGSGSILGQTWDMHASAAPYVIIIQLDGGVLFSVAGCLGMAGINSFGVAIGINNLCSIDAHVGVIWPALVRKAMNCKDAILAKEEVMNAQIGSGHHYGLADINNFISIETSGTKKKIIRSTRDYVFVHANHCLDEEMANTHIIPKSSTSLLRYEVMQNYLNNNEILSPESAFLALREVYIEPQKEEPDRVATCGTLVMDTELKVMFACSGKPDAEVFSHAEFRFPR